MRALAIRTLFQSGLARPVTGAVIFGLALAAVSGCSFVEDRSDRYMKVSPAEPLRVPAVYDKAVKLEDAGRYQIPPAEKAFIAKPSFQVPSAPQPESDITESLFSVRRADGSEWLASTEPPGRIWPAMKQYWERVGADVDEAEIEDGLMKVSFSATSAKGSSWLRRHELVVPGSENGLATTGSLILQVEVAQGLRKKSSEVRITSIYSPENREAAVEVGRSPLLVLKSLAYGLNESVSDFNTYSLVAQRIDSEQKVRLVTEAVTVPYIEMKLTEGRAWFELEQAVRSSEFDLVDQNRANGRFFIQYEESRSGKTPGFFSSMFRDEDAFEPKNSLSDQFNFQIELVPVGEDMRIYVLPRDAGVPFDLSSLSGNQTHRADALTILNEVMEKLG